MRTLTDIYGKIHAIDGAIGGLIGDPTTWPTAPVPQTGQTSSYDSFDDGSLEKGVEWPDPRFTNNKDGTVTDNLTGLVWMKNANCWNGPSSHWNEALEDGWMVVKEGFCGLEDGSSAGEWRLPNILELHSLVSYTEDTDIFGLPKHHPFQNVVVDGFYWSSTANPFEGNHVYSIRFGGGLISGSNHRIRSHHRNNVDNNYFWPVRDP